ncbi:hypothetical protein TNCV_1683491 [Trichonephila clavipes]|nr:hypothetical protein TNCV_1683491 [Trichonephila clavipes]
MKTRYYARATGHDFHEGDKVWFMEYETLQGTLSEAADPQGSFFLMAAQKHIEQRLISIGLNLKEIRTSFVPPSVSEYAKQIVLQWIPGHCGVTGNEFADHIAKKGASIQHITSFLARGNYKRNTVIMPIHSRKAKQELKTCAVSYPKPWFKISSPTNVSIGKISRDPHDLRNAHSVKTPETHPEIKVGDVVLIEENITNILLRKFGKIERALPGRDNTTHYYELDKRLTVETNCPTWRL